MWVYDPFHHHHREFGEPDEEAMYANPFASGFNLASASRYFGFQTDRDEAVKLAKVTGQTVHIHPDYQIELRDPAPQPPARQGAATPLPKSTLPKTISTTGATRLGDGYVVYGKDGWTGFYNPLGQLTDSAFNLEGGAGYLDANGNLTLIRIDGPSGFHWYNSNGQFLQTTPRDGTVQPQDPAAAQAPTSGLDPSLKAVPADLLAQLVPRQPLSDTGLLSMDDLMNPPRPPGHPASKADVQPPMSAAQAQALANQWGIGTPTPSPSTPEVLGLNDVVSLEQRLQGYVDLTVHAPPATEQVAPIYPAVALGASGSVWSLVAAATPHGITSTLGMPAAPPRPIAETADFYNFGGPLLTGRAIADSSRAAKVGQFDVGSLSPSDRKLAQAMLANLEVEPNVAAPAAPETPSEVYREGIPFYQPNKYPWTLLPTYSHTESTSQTVASAEAAVGGYYNFAANFVNGGLFWLYAGTEATGDIEDWANLTPGTLTIGTPSFQTIGVLPEALQNLRAGLNSLRALSGAYVEETTARKVISETQGAITNLGSRTKAANTELFSHLEPGQGMSGAFDHDTGTFVLRPSTILEPPPDGWVSRYGGHEDVVADLGEALGEDLTPGAQPSRLSGFSVVKEPDGSLRSVGIPESSTIRLTVVVGFH
jgi:hypothetical protein